MPLSQFVWAGLWSTLSAVVVGFITYRQATKVALTQAQAALGVRQLENSSAVQNLWHDDLKETKRQLDDKTSSLIDSIRACSKAEAECKTLQERNDELDACVAQQKSEIQGLTNAKNSLEDTLRYHTYLTSSSAELRRLADQIDRTPTS